jgi:hypothetical protein
MSYLSHRRALPAALAACLALGVGTAATANAAAPAQAAKATRGARAKKPATKRAARRNGGGAILNGARVPGKRVGSVGDFYLRTSDRTLYGPKTARGWGRPVSLVGPTGAQGAQGNPGANGLQGPAGTPAFGAGVVTTIAAPAALTGTYDATTGDLVSPDVEVGTVTVPAGVSLAQLRLRVTPGAGFTGDVGAGCDISNGTAWVTSAFAYGPQLAMDAIGWTTYAQPTTFAVRCSLSGPPGTPGTTVSASVAGSQVVVFGANVPGA